MIALFKFRANDLNPSKGKQIEFNVEKVTNFFEFTNDEEHVTFQYKSLERGGAFDGQTIKVYLKLSPSRGDYKIYQNADGSIDLKDFFLDKLHLDASSNIDDFFALKKVNSTKYLLFYIPQGKEFEAFYNICVSNSDLIIENTKKESKVLVSTTDNTSYLPYLTALRTKPFMLLAGISGTGKSRIVRELAFKSCPEF